MLYQQMYEKMLYSQNQKSNHKYRKKKDGDVSMLRVLLTITSCLMNKKKKMHYFSNLFISKIIFYSQNIKAIIFQ